MAAQRGGARLLTEGMSEADGTTDSAGSMAGMRAENRRLAEIWRMYDAHGRPQTAAPWCRFNVAVPAVTMLASYIERFWHDEKLPIYRAGEWPPAIAASDEHVKKKKRMKQHKPVRTLSGFTYAIVVAPQSEALQRRYCLVADMGVTTRDAVLHLPGLGDVVRAIEAHARWWLHAPAVLWFVIVEQGMHCLGATDYGMPASRRASTELRC
jgi:hypothetical protein